MSADSEKSWSFGLIMTWKNNGSHSCFDVILPILRFIATLFSWLSFLCANMACGIKTIYSVRDLFPEKTRILLLNALVISHNYSSILLNGLTENLLTTLEKQLSWAVKACFNRNKFDHSSDLKIFHNILPIRYFLEYKSVLYFWKVRHGILPAFAKVKPTTAVIKNQKRTNKLYVSLPRENKVMKKLLLQ